MIVRPDLLFASASKASPPHICWFPFLGCRDPDRSAKEHTSWFPLGYSRSPNFTSDTDPMNLRFRMHLLGSGSLNKACYLCAPDLLQQPLSSLLPKPLAGPFQISQNELKTSSVKARRVRGKAGRGGLGGRRREPGWKVNPERYAASGL